MRLNSEFLPKMAKPIRLLSIRYPPFDFGDPNRGSCPIPLKKSVFEWKAAARGGVVAEVEERLLPHLGKSGDGIGISLASLRRF